MKIEGTQLRDRINRQLSQPDPYAYRDQAKAAAAALHQPVAKLDSAEPKQRPAQPLDRDAPKQTGRKKGAAIIHCLIVRYGKRKLDDDNLAFAHKFLRDAIAERLGIDDGSDLVEWDYDQVITSGATGTQILITELC